MTKEEFTKLALEEAEKYCPDRTVTMSNGERLYIEHSEKRGFLAGAEWGQDQGAEAMDALETENAIIYCELDRLVNSEVVKQGPYSDYSEALDNARKVIHERRKLAEREGKEVCYQRIENDDRKGCYSRSNEGCEIAGEKCIHCGQPASKKKLAERESGGAKE